MSRKKKAKPVRVDAYASLLERQAAAKFQRDMKNGVKTVEQILRSVPTIPTGSKTSSSGVRLHKEPAEDKLSKKLLKFLIPNPDSKELEIRREEGIHAQANYRYELVNKRIERLYRLKAHLVDPIKVQATLERLRSATVLDEDGIIRLERRLSDYSKLQDALKLREKIKSFLVDLESTLLKERFRASQPNYMTSSTVDIPESMKNRVAKRRKRIRVRKGERVLNGRGPYVKFVDLNKKGK